jgi:hypothetical protein
MGGVGRGQDGQEFALSEVQSRADPPPPMFAHRPDPIPGETRWTTCPPAAKTEFRPNQ